MHHVVRDKSRAMRRWSPYHIPTQRHPEALRNLYWGRSHLQSASPMGYPPMGQIPVPLRTGSFYHPYAVPRGGLDDHGPALLSNSGPNFFPRTAFDNLARPPNPREVFERSYASVPPNLSPYPCVNWVHDAVTPRHRYRDLQPYKVPSRPDRVVPSKPLAYRTWGKYATLCLGSILKTWNNRNVCGQQRVPDGEGAKPAGSNAPSPSRAQAVKTTINCIRVRCNRSESCSGHTLIGPLCWFDMRGHSYIPDLLRDLAPNRGENRYPTTSQQNPTVSSAHQQNVAPQTERLYLYREDRTTGDPAQCTGLSSLPRQPRYHPLFGQGVTIPVLTASESTQSPAPQSLPSSSSPPGDAAANAERWAYEALLVDLLQTSMNSFLARKRSHSADPPAERSEAKREKLSDSTIQTRHKSPPARMPEAAGLMKDEPPCKRPKFPPEAAGPSHSTGVGGSLTAGARGGSATSREQGLPAGEDASAGEGARHAEMQPSGDGRLGPTGPGETRILLQVELSPNQQSPPPQPQLRDGEGDPGQQ